MSNREIKLIDRELRQLKEIIKPTFRDLEKIVFLENFKEIKLSRIELKKQINRKS